jgi:ribosomal protein L11 methyltransferase
VRFVSSEAPEALHELLGTSDLPVSSWVDADSVTHVFSCFLETEEEAGAARDILQRTINLAVADGILSAEPRFADIEMLPPENWAESWKRHFRVNHASPRILIKPTWETVEPEPGIHVIELDPGMSFGTGLHGTTQACLKFIDDLADRHADRPLIDLGCGSGILATAAALLGYSPVTAFDIDPIAVEATRVNAAANGVEVTVYEAALGKEPLAGKADVVIVNILAGVLIDCAASVSQMVGDGGTLVLSGILISQFDSVEAAYADHGWRVEQTLTIGEWKSGLLRRV